jgi:transcriptional regulator with XRE-family HTH domain
MLDEVRIEGAKIRALRESRGWTQRDLWQRSGVDQAVISALESNQKGDIFYRTIRKLAHTLGVRTDDLLASTESIKIEPADPQINVAMRLVNDMTTEERDAALTFMNYVLAQRRHQSALSRKNLKPGDSNVRLGLRSTKRARRS